MSRSEGEAEPARGRGARARGRDWWILGAPLGILLVAALVLDRSAWPSLVGDEATYLMAAQSLVADLDFRYGPQDHERFVAATGHQPDGLILQSPDGGTTLLFGKPLLYPLFLAPWVALGGIRAAVVANTLLLALTALGCAAALRRRFGGADGAPVWIACVVFGSVVFVQVFWLHADLLLLCLVALALALAYGTPAEQAERGEGVTGWRWLTSGALLATVTVTRPFYAFLFLPLARRALDSRRGLLPLVAGALSVLAVLTAAELSVRGSWSAYAGVRQAYYQYTGFPETESDPAWPQRVDRRGANRWTGSNVLPYGVDSRLTAWNVLYLTLGRHVGLLPYFLPALLALLYYRPGRGRTTLLLAVLFGIGAFLLARPFNFWGGGGALANRYFLPLYPALWFVPARLPSLRACGVAMLVATPFLFPVWLHPNLFLRDTGGSYAWVSPVAQRILPYETTQNQLKPSGRDDFIHNDLWIKPLDPGLHESDGTLTVEPGRESWLLVGSERPIARFEVDAEISGLEVRGAEEIDRRSAPAGQAGEIVLLEPARARARHPMWWRREDFLLYRLGVRAPQGESPARFRLRAVGLAARPEAQSAAL